MNATIPDGQMNVLEKCFIDIPSLSITLKMQSLPDISDGKGAQYGDETSIGRSTPFKTYQNSDNRTIGWTAHYMVTQEKDIPLLFSYIRAVQAAVYPFDSKDTNLGGNAAGIGGAPYAPPPVCKLQCGHLLSKLGPINAVLKSYSIKFDPSVPWDEKTYLPYKFDLDLSFDVIYNQSDLPGANRIFNDSSL